MRPCELASACLAKSGDLSGQLLLCSATVGQRSFTPGCKQSTPRLLSALQTKIVKLLSNFTFSCNLRHYTTASTAQLEVRPGIIHVIWCE